VSRFGCHLLASLLALAAVPAPAANPLPVLLGDLNPLHPTVEQPLLGARPALWTALGGKAVFVANAPATGFEPWVTDGTPLGTFQLADVCPGRCYVAPLFLSVADDALFFLADASGQAPPRELWRTDGTRAGTYGLGVSASSQGTHASTGGRLIFTGCTGADCEPWSSDGTASGTRPIMDLEPGPQGSNPYLMAAAGARVVLATSGGASPGLWGTDGTAEGTVRLEVPGSVGDLGASGSRVFVAASSGLWLTDGTADGTALLDAGLSFAGRVGFKADGAGGVLFVSLGDREVWRSDGTPGGTRQVTETPSGTLAAPEVLGDRVAAAARDLAGVVRLWVSSGGQLAQPIVSGCPAGCPTLEPPFTLVRAGSRLVFVGRDQESGPELWATDGTAAGTQLLEDICPGPCAAGIAGLSSHLGRAFFAAAGAPGEGTELWASDGTVEGTLAASRFAVADAFGAAAGQQFRGVTAANRLFFGAADPEYGLQPWTTNGSPADTRLITVIGSGGFGSLLHGLSAIPDGAAFAACDGEFQRLYRSDGTPEGTVPIPEPEPPVPCRSPAHFRVARAVADHIFLVHTRHLPVHEHASEGALWRVSADGTGWTRLANLAFSLPDFLFEILELVPYRGGIAFLNRGPDAGDFALWTSDGTVAGTRSVALDSGLVFPRELTAAGERLFFVASPNGLGAGDDLWTSDGSDSGTHKLATSLRRGASDFVGLGTWTYFLGDRELWRTDGTPGGTARVRADPVAPEVGFNTGSGLTVFQGALWFSAWTDSGHLGLFRSDGTKAGTAVVHEAVRPNDVTALTELTPVAGQLYFVSETPEHGRELWVTDGTGGGTSLVRDLAPGVRSSLPAGLTGAGERLFFSATDGAHGFELWTSDGTAAGTQMVHDTAPGLFSSFPEQLTASGARLFFTADDALHGREPWVLALPGVGDCVPSAERLCLLGGRYAVEASWRDFAGHAGVGRAAPLTGDTGTFWFFDAANLEVVLKVLDGTRLNGHRWVFYGALSSVEYTLAVTDTLTGAVARYFNPAGNLASVADTRAFGPQGATGAPARVAPRRPPDGGRVKTVRGAAGACVAGPERLCLQGGRFAVSVAWKDFEDRTGVGQARAVTGDTGSFWFFDAANVELLVKVLDGRGVNGKFWVFYGALSSVEYTLTVTDTQTGVSRSYHNPSGRLASRADTDAF
jgi:ELWxxDGT repeat protein